MTIPRLNAYDHALECLTRRGRSTRELTRWLAQRGHEKADIDAAVEKLLDLGLLNDAEFARTFTRSRALSKGTSRRRIQAELARRGVARETVDAAIAEVAVDEELDEGAIVEAAARKKLRAMTKLAPDVRERRLMGFLARRGYEPGVVRATVKRLLRD